MEDKIMLFEEFSNKLNEMTDYNFRPDYIPVKQQIPKGIFKKLFPKTSMTSKWATNKIDDFFNEKMFTHMQAFIGIGKDGAKYRIHQHQYWLREEKVNITLISVSDESDPENEKHLGRNYVNTEVFLSEYKSRFKEIKTHS